MAKHSDYSSGAMDANKCGKHLHVLVIYKNSRGDKIYKYVEIMFGNLVVLLYILCIVAASTNFVPETSQNAHDFFNLSTVARPFATSDHNPFLHLQCTITFYNHRVLWR